MKPVENEVTANRFSCGSLSGAATNCSCTDWARLLSMTSAARTNTRTRHRVRNALLFSLLCVVIAVVQLKIGFMVLDRWGDDGFIRWGGLAGFTLVLFGCFVGDSEKFLRERRFWVVTAVLLSAHLAAFAIILTHVAEWKLTWFMVMVIEYPVFLFFRDKFVLPFAKTPSGDDRSSS